jgi:hypothetical protein
MNLEEPFATTLASAQAGAEWALAQLYRDLHPRILRYLRAMESQRPSPWGLVQTPTAGRSD